MLSVVFTAPPVTTLFAPTKEHSLKLCEPKGTFFETLRTEKNILLDAVAMLVERNSLRAIGRIKQSKPNTILHWLDLAGQHATAVNKHFIRSLHLTQAQIDELWTFVKKNRSILIQTIPAI